MADNKLPMTKEKFMAYERLRQYGVINMLDVTNGTLLTGLSEVDYKDIIRNYCEYANKFLN